MYTCLEISKRIACQAKGDYAVEPVTREIIIFYCFLGSRSCSISGTIILATNAVLLSRYFYMRMSDTRKIACYLWLMKIID